MMELILVCLFLSLNIYQSFVSEGQLKSDEANVSKRKSETFMTSADFFHHLGGKTSKEVISWESFPTKLAGSDEKIFGQELFSLFWMTTCQNILFLAYIVFCTQLISNFAASLNFADLFSFCNVFEVHRISQPGLDKKVFCSKSSKLEKVSPTNTFFGVLSPKNYTNS